MQQWSPFWRWLAAGVLVAMTVAWVAQTHVGGREPGFAPSHEGWRMQKMPGMMSTAGACTNGTGTAIAVAGRSGKPAQQLCVNVPGATVSVSGDGNLKVNGSTITGSGSPALSAALQRQRTQLQRQEAELQAQQAQLSARIAALQARSNSLGQ
jgi:hypothetical protein